jgi:N-acetylmuramoyl-L-alanine amidase
MRGWKSDPGPAFPMRRYTKIIEDRGDEKAEYDNDDTLWQAVVNLNVRSSPQMGDNIIGALSPKNLVQVIESPRGWLLIKRVDTAESSGWVYSKYLERQD